LKIRLQADSDIDPDIRKGLLRREPSIDFQSATDVIPDGTIDPEVLQIAADDNCNKLVILRDIDAFNGCGLAAKRFPVFEMCPEIIG